MKDYIESLKQQLVKLEVNLQEEIDNRDSEDCEDDSGELNESIGYSSGMIDMIKEFIQKFDK